MELSRKTDCIEYKTLESETIVFCSSLYAVIALMLVGVVFRFWLQEECEEAVIGVYALLSISFLIFIGIQSKRRTKLNKLPSRDVLDLCYLIRENLGNESSVWHTTYSSFNNRAMELFFTYEISTNIPAHDYFSFMLAERYLEIEGVVDIPGVNNNNLKITLTKKAKERLAIYEESKSW